MKHFLASLVFITSISFVSLSQQGQLDVNINAYNYSGENCYMLSVIKASDTVHARTITDEYLLDGGAITVDSLLTGLYFVNITNCGAPTYEFFNSATATVEIRSNEIAHISFYMDQYVDYTKLDEYTQEEVILGRNEIQFDFSYFDFRWNPDGNNPKFNLGLACSGYSWIAFSKHVGFLMGGGVGFEFAQLQIDPESSANFSNEVKSNYYNYIYAKYDMKVRFSSLNQQSAQIKAHTILFDIGAQYNLPLYFKRVTRFNIQDKMVNSFIHRYSDVRLYAELGIANFQFFASYRPFDFVAKDFPEFPKFNAGMKFNIHF